MIKNLKNDRSAVVGIVTAILLVSLLFTVLVVINLEFVPEWAEDKEAEHMEQVSNQFSQMAHTIQKQATFQSDESISSPIKLGSEPLWFFTSAPSGGSLSIIPDTFNFSVDSKNVSLKQHNGMDYTGIGQGDVKQLLPNREETEEDITKISYFMLNITSFKVGNKEWGMVKTTVKDANNNLVGSVEVKAIGIQPETQINVRTADQNGNELYNQPIIIMKSDNFTNYRINLLNPDYRFTEILYSAAAPFDITLILSSSDGEPSDGKSPDISADYTIAYEKYSGTGGGEGEEVGSGGVVGNISDSYQCGTLKYSSDNSYFVDQDYTFDGSGAVIHQGILGKKGNIFFQPPSISITKTSAGKTRMEFLIVDVTSGAAGGGAQISGNGISSVKTRYNRSEITRFETNELNLTIKTSYVNAWKEFFNYSFTNAGFSGTDYTISAAGDKITINFKGKDKTDKRDIDFYLNYSIMEAEVGIPMG